MYTVVIQGGIQWVGAEVKTECSGSSESNPSELGGSGKALWRCWPLGLGSQGCPELP